MGAWRGIGGAEWWHVCPRIMVGEKSLSCSVQCTDWAGPTAMIHASVGHTLAFTTFA